MKHIAKLISYFFHPVLMPLAGVLIIFNSGIYQTDIPFEIKKFVYLIVALFSIVFPLALLSILMYWNMVQDIELTERRERFIPMIFSLVSIFILYIIINRTIPIKLLKAYTLSMVVVVVLYLLSNFRFKTSLHLLGLGGITGLLATISILFQADLFFLLSVAILISGIVGTARIYLQAHTLTEIISGYLTGFFGVFCILYFIV
jgi:hypothetical protein